MRAVIVGAGQRGKHHARVASSLGLETYTVDPNRDADFTSLDDAPRAEIVAVATPVDQLAAAARSAMLIGCECLVVEKPMATTVSDALSLVACARQTRTRLAVGYTDRYDPLVRELAAMLERLVGGIERFVFVRRRPKPSWASPGPALDLAVHDIDLLYHFGFVPALVDSRCDEDGVAAELMCGAARAALDCRYDSSRRSAQIIAKGPRGAVECDLIERVIRRTGPRPTPIGGDGARADGPLLGLWSALLAGRGPDGGQGVAVLALALELSAARARAA
jgi:predicted dehydrogenase